MSVASVAFGDISGFLALALVAATALLMFLRARFLKAFGGLESYRLLHIAMATGAGVFLVLHALTFIGYPASLGIFMGYASFGMAAVVWATGTAFLERVRDSLFFHGPMALCLGALVVVHASAESATLDPFWSESALVVVVSLAVANTAYHARKVAPHG